jgi:periplasmic protein TonB
MPTDATAAVAAGIQPPYLILTAALAILILVSMGLHVHRTRVKAHSATRHREGDASADPFASVLFSSLPERDLRSAAKTTAWSVAVHACIVAALLWATSHTIGANAEEGPINIGLPEEPPPPLPTPLPPPPDPTAPAPVEVPIGFRTLTVPDIVPPNIPPPQFGDRITDDRDFTGEGIEGGRRDGTPGARPQSDLAAGPIFTPSTVEPELKNTAEVERALVRMYPPLLRDSGIGGTVMMWFLIDETGRVVKTQLKESSGHAQLDEAAARVASVMEFVPAKNRDHNVPVWVAIPIMFTTR